MCTTCVEWGLSCHSPRLPSLGMISIQLTEEQAVVLLDTVKRNYRAITDPADARRFTLALIEDTLIDAMKEYYRD